jgi:hypothetical protein
MCQFEATDRFRTSSACRLIAGTRSSCVPGTARGSWRTASIVVALEHGLEHGEGGEWHLRRDAGGAKPSRRDRIATRRTSRLGCVR